MCHINISWFDLKWRWTAEFAPWNWKLHAWFRFDELETSFNALIQMVGKTRTYITTIIVQYSVMIWRRCEDQAVIIRSHWFLMCIALPTTASSLQLQLINAINNQRMPCNHSGSGSTTTWDIPMRERLRLLVNWHHILWLGCNNVGLSYNRSWAKQRRTELYNWATDRSCRWRYQLSTLHSILILCRTEWLDMWIWYDRVSAILDSKKSNQN